MADALLPSPPPAGRPDIRAAVAADPHAFEFNRVMRELESLFPGRPRFGRSIRPGQDPVRLAQDATVDFAPSMLAAWVPGADARADLLVVHFFGLWGPDGPLPLHLTEYARNRTRNERDPTFQRFADMFHHRALSLLYRAWADVRPSVSFDRPADDRFATYVGALAGLGTEALRRRDAMPDRAKLHFAGLLANQTRHAEGLSAILSSLFAVSVRVASFVGAWLSLPGRELTRLGRNGGSARDSAGDSGRLGGGALLGRRVWTRQHKFRLVFGPLDLDQYERLLPSGPSFHRLVPVVRNYAGDVLAWDVQFVLRRQDVPDTRLGRYGRLGWTTWLKPRRDVRDAADLLLDASADSHARTVVDTVPPPTPEPP